MIGILILIILGVAILIGLVVVGRRAQTQEDPLQARLAEYGDRELPASLEELELSLSFQDRVIVPMYNTLAKTVIQFTPENQIEMVRAKIEQAGLTGKVEPTTFFGQRV